MKYLPIMVLVLYISITHAQQSSLEKIALLEQKLGKQYESKEFKNCLYTVDEILKIAPYHPRHLKNAFSFAYELKDTVLMMQYCKQIYTSDPENTTYGNYLLWFTLLKAKFKDAEELGKKLYYEDRNNASIIMNYAHAKYALKKYTEADKLYAESIQLIFTKEDFEKGLLEDCNILHQKFTALYFDLLKSKLTKLFLDTFSKYKTGNNLQTEIDNYVKNSGDKLDYKHLINLQNKVIQFESYQSPMRYVLISKAYGSLAKYAFNNGNYRQCIQYYQSALSFDAAISDYRKSIIRYTNIAVIYRQIGFYDSANIFLYKAYEAATFQADEWKIAYTLQEYGSLSKDVDNKAQAKTYYYKANQYYQKIYNPQAICNIQYKLANVMDNNDSVIHYNLKALNWAELYEIDDNYLVIYNNLATAYADKKNYKQALAYYFKAFNSNDFKHNSNSKKRASLLENIGYCYTALNNYDSAIYYLKQSNQILKTIRNNLSAKAKIEFYANNLVAPQLLATCYLKKNNPIEAFEYVEQTKSMLLAEQMGYNLNNNINVDSIQKQMKEDQVYLVFSNMNSNLLVGSKSYIAISKTEVKGNVILDSSFVLAAAKYKYGPYLDTIINRLIRFRRTGEKNGIIGKELRIFTIYYQLSLANAATQKRSTIKKTADKEDVSLTKIAAPLSHVLYRQFVKPIEPLLKGKKELIIMADGNLSFLPFESLLTDDNKFLGELYSISYLPSFKVANILAKKPINTSNKVLALGNPVYEDLTEANKQISKARKLYNVENGFNWANLPGTDTEVKSIANDFKNVTTLMANNATEEEIKNLSKQGKLKEYAILHFATHGYVTTDYPELSTLVLNQQNKLSTDDGYLTAEEIEKLSINANIVCLSACQTGQGALKEGEGVMGLSNSFLLAGAKSTIVSMWSVADDATSKFMSNMYGLVAQQNISFKEALFLTRQKFIRGEFGEEYKKPFYWSPFVYFGN